VHRGAGVQGVGGPDAGERGHHRPVRHSVFFPEPGELSLQARRASPLWSKAVSAGSSRPPWSDCLPWSRDQRWFEAAAAPGGYRIAAATGRPQAGYAQLLARKRSA